MRARPKRRGKPKDDGEQSVIAGNILDRDFEADRSKRRVDMKQTCYVGLDVSKDATAICVRRSDGVVERVCETATEPDAICTALTDLRGGLERVVLETGRMANWLHGELTRRGLPAICVNARQVYRTRNEARADVFDYIERFYNPRRRHSKLGYLSPMVFEDRAMQT